MALTGELQPVVDVARQRMQVLQADIESGRDVTGRKTRELQRLQLYTAVVKRLNRSDVLMPEVTRAQLGGRDVMLLHRVDSVAG